MNSAADSDPELHRAIAQHRAGHGPEAERLYRAFLARHPGHAGANHNLGQLIAQRGGDGLEHLKAARDANPAQGQYWLSYAKALLAAGSADEARKVLDAGAGRGLGGPAVDALRAKLAAAADPDAVLARCLEAVAQGPGNAAAHFELGNAFVTLGQPEEAIAAYRDAVARDADLAEAHFRLGSLLSEHERVAEGFAHFMRRAELVHGQGQAAEGPQPEHRIKHDREQREYLAATQPGAAFHLADGSRLAGAAVNPAPATAQLQARWREASPRMIVIDDFLMPQALEKLRAYCAGSAIWRRNYAAGYIGATPEDGFSCPLLAQIVEEIRSTYAFILAPHRFHYLGAFKYDSALSTGTNTHADNSAVNVNLYITPDQANLDPQSGGMDIWNVAPDSEAHMRQLNGDEKAARDFIDRSGAQLTRVAHRANRAVIFRSDLLHKTSDCRFEEGYLNKRINVSLLFGERGG